MFYIYIMQPPTPLFACSQNTFASVLDVYKVTLSQWLRAWENKSRSTFTTRVTGACSLDFPVLPASSSANGMETVLTSKAILRVNVLMHQRRAWLRVKPHVIIPREREGKPRPGRLSDLLKVMYRLRGKAASGSLGSRGCRPGFSPWNSYWSPGKKMVTSADSSS